MCVAWLQIDQNWVRISNENGIMFINVGNVDMYESFVTEYCNKRFGSFSFTDIKHKAHFPLVAPLSGRPPGTLTECSSRALSAQNAPPVRFQICLAIIRV